MTRKSWVIKASIILFCILVVLLVGTAGISLAKYISAVRTGPHDVGVMEMYCKYTLENSDLTFVNAGFQQQVGSSSGPVQMNSYSSTVVEVANVGVNTGMSYKYALVFYLPMIFANHTMFQLVHLGENDAAQHASPLYTFVNSAGELKPTVTTAAKDEYASLSGSEDGKLNIMFSTSTVSVETTFSRTFKTYTRQTNGSSLCPFTVKKTQSVEFCKIVMNLDATKYFLSDGDSERFMLRVAPLTQMNEDVISVAWNADDYQAQTPTTTAKGFSVNFDKTAKTIDIVYTNEQGVSTTYQNVYVGDCIGVTFPSRMNVLFTQMEK